MVPNIALAGLHQIMLRMNRSIIALGWYPQPLPSRQSSANRVKGNVNGSQQRRPSTCKFRAHLWSRLKRDNSFSGTETRPMQRLDLGIHYGRLGAAAGRRARFSNEKLNDGASS